MDNILASAAINDENVSPSSVACLPLAKVSPAFATATLRQSQRDNILDNCGVMPIKIKGSLQHPRPLPVTPTRYEDVLKLDEEESWKERCAVITRSDHEENIRCAQDILNNLIENLPIKSTSCKLEHLEISLDTGSISSTDFTPSESSFDTANELISSPALPDLLQPEALHDWRADSDHSETDYESAIDSGEVAAPSSALSVIDAVFDAKSSLYRDESCDAREVTPIPQLLADDQPLSAVINRSLNSDSDREKTPTPSDLTLLATEVCEVTEVSSLAEKGVGLDYSTSDCFSSASDANLEYLAKNESLLDSKATFDTEYLETLKTESSGIVASVHEVSVDGSKGDGLVFTEVEVKLETSVLTLSESPASLDTTGVVPEADDITVKSESLGEYKITFDGISTTHPCSRNEASLKSDDIPHSLINVEPLTVVGSQTECVVSNESAIVLHGKSTEEYSEFSNVELDSFDQPTHISGSLSATNCDEIEHVPVSVDSVFLEESQSFSQYTGQSCEDSVFFSDSITACCDAAEAWLESPILDCNETSAAVVGLHSDIEVDQLGLTVSANSDTTLDNICVGSSLHSLDTDTSIPAGDVANVHSKCDAVIDTPQKATADIKLLLERAARVVADLRDTVPPGSAEILDVAKSSENDVGCGEVFESGLKDSTESATVVDSSVGNQIARACLDSSSESGEVSIQCCDKNPSSCNSPSNENLSCHLDQCLELEATIIAAELIKLSLSGGEESETYQSMKERKMADLENNESRVVGDVVPNLDENVNPFQSKSHVASSPLRVPNANGDTLGEGLKTPILGSKSLKNGEVAPKVSPSATRTPTRKTSSPSSRTAPLSNSPKRKGSSSLESGLAEGERENGVGSPFTPTNRLGRSPPRTPARDSNKDLQRKQPVKTNNSSPKAGSPLPGEKLSIPGSIDGAGEGFTRSAPEGAPAQDHDSESSMTKEFKRPLPKPAPRVKSNSDQPDVSHVVDDGTCKPASGAALDDCQIMVRSVEDGVNSEAGPDVAEFADGEFRSAADVFKDPSAFEFLQMAGNKQLSESALARMSLYVKFDPLLKAISPVSRRSLSKGGTSDHSQTSMSEPSGEDLLLGTPSKSEPMLDLSSTPDKGDGCSEGRLLDLTPLRNQDGQPSRHQYSEEEFAQALRMQELLFQEQLIKKDREWDERTRRQDKEHEVTTVRLMADNEQLVHEFQKLQESHKQMTQIVSEYERTISQLITDREAEKLATGEKEARLKKERDHALEDLQSVEGAFADLHRRYEKSKVALDGFKKNEELLKTYVAEGQAKLKKQEQKYELLKRHAEEKLECANAEIEALRRSSEAELAALGAQLKKAEMKVSGLERSLETKSKENAELTNICDELIAKVGHSNS